MPALLASILQEPALPTQLIWLIAIGTMAYLGYKVYKQEEAFVRMLSGINALVILVAGYLVAALPSTTLAVFGPLEGIMTLVMSVFLPMLLGITVVVIVNLVIQAVKAEQAVPGI